MDNPKILFYDIETSPNLAYVWGKYEQDVIDYKSEWEILSFAYKINDGPVHVVSQQSRSELSLLHFIHKMMSDVDIIVAHNGDAFDLKKLQARFAFHSLPPLKHLPSVDTKKVAKLHFAFNSNKLDDLGKYLKLGRKVKHPGFEMWLGCLRGEKKSWAQMEHYNKQDVVLLAKVYKKLRPWMRSHPNVALLQNPHAKGGCPKCGSSKIVKNGLRANSASLQQLWRCNKCGGAHTTARKKSEV